MRTSKLRFLQFLQESNRKNEVLIRNSLWSSQGWDGKTKTPSLAKKKKQQGLITAIGLTKKNHGFPNPNTDPKIYIKTAFILK